MAKKRKLECKPEPEPEPEPETATVETVEEEQQQQLEQEEQVPFEVDEEEEQVDTGDAEVAEEEDEEEDEEVDEEVDPEEDGEEEEEAEAAKEGDVQNPSNLTASSTAVAASSAPWTAANTTADDDDDGEEPVQNLLEPFNKEQLVDLLREATENHPDVLDRIRKLADVDPVHRKVFVHGLGWDTNAETLISAFKQYGEIEDCNAVCDKISGKSKGYGFILFKHRSGARKALRQPQKRIGNRMTACQLASAGPIPPPAPAAPPVSEYTLRKIYVSNVSADIDPQRLLNFFAKYGEIEEGPLGLDKQTGKPKGFSLFVYKTVESAKKALEDPQKNFEGHILHCQKAIDGPKPNKQYYHHHNTHHPQHGSHYQRNENPNFMGAMGSHGSAVPTPGHMMAPSPAGVPFNQAATQALNPALGQAITALLATQGAGLGLTNLLGTLGSTGVGPQVNQNVPQMLNNTSHGMQGGYGSQSVANNISPGVMGGYGNQSAMQGGYPNAPMGQGNAGRSQQGVGHMGGVAPYMGH
ncbi:UBP1-associated protein 2B-like [Telopea speciosissima]|uniref:UBP1-associated protein 2B-like n=1 Tax=Telopea speciosissima TaxID=54955 RepID=UPI001CC6055A|nr:UBP1-associated protein 2B-like [Telopea speciosissima]XP_043723067.1 UBP1-associated protein 2B-like [Telopea speciosissima]XP_043723068.1 UBP1-associated protein 2B-like [Telopea speciosissima]XP_043723069.1 UBP1-associated protein 2B-like [Telopea speciosissima]XP_043723070.1 UBP1-associated protein 2B-like [Telopea speciosissima]XP_043723071.1 UBP1-associated protein 2B-like [Telopea speciosissima]